MQIDGFAPVTARIADLTLCRSRPKESYAQNPTLTAASDSFARRGGGGEPMSDLIWLADAQIGRTEPFFTSRMASHVPTTDDSQALIDATHRIQPSSDGTGGGDPVF